MGTIIAGNSSAGARVAAKDDADGAVALGKLRDRELANLKFRRQHALGPFIVDFYCAEARLIIELDGDIHLDPVQRANDEERDARCRAYGYMVLRFTTQQIGRDLDGVLFEILSRASGLCRKTEPC